MSVPNEIHVNIGEVKVATGTDVLMARLGSCVGIAFLWKKRKIYGLAHCLLPEGSFNANAIGAKYVTQAIPSLMALMEIRAQDVSEIDAVITGGGNMTAPKMMDGKKLIGELNTQIASRLIRSCRIKIIHEDIGGETGRKIYVQSETGEFVIKPIPRIESREAV